MGSIFSSPKPPPIIPPAPMPVPDTVTTAKNKRKTATMVQQRSGRASTIMTDYGVAGRDKFG